MSCNYMLASSILLILILSLTGYNDFVKNHRCLNANANVLQRGSQDRQTMSTESGLRYPLHSYTKVEHID